MSTAVSLNSPKFYAWNPDTGEPLSNGKVYFYESGTSTKKDTYTDQERSSTNTNPVELNSAGYAPIFLGDGDCKIVLEDSDGATVWTADPIAAPVLTIPDSPLVNAEYVSEYTDLNEAVSETGLEKRTLIIDQDEALSAALTVPSNICLYFKRSGFITVNGYDLTINGSINAGLWQIFVNPESVGGSPEIDYSYPEWVGLLGDGSNEKGKLQALFNLGIPYFGHLKNVDYSVSGGITRSYSGTVTIDWGGVSLIAIDAEFKSFIDITISDGTLYFNNFRGHCADRVVRPVILNCGNDNSSIIVDGYYTENVYEASSHSASAKALRILGTGRNATVSNAVINKVDSVTGGQPTVGIHIGEANQGFENATVRDSVFYDVTEQGGSSNNDSDAVKIFGSVGGKHHALVENIKHINNGNDVKRTIKTQTDTFEIRNIEARMTACKILTIAGPQYGSGLIENIRFYATNTTCRFLIVGPQLAAQNAPWGGNCTIKDVYAYGDVDSSFTFQPIYAGQRDESSSFNWLIENINISGFDSSAVTGFIMTRATSNDTQYTFRNINCLLWNNDWSSFRAFNIGQANDINMNKYYCPAVFENVRFPQIIRLQGTYVGNTVIYCNLIPYRITSSSISIESNDNADSSNTRIGYIGRHCRCEHGLYKYEWSSFPVQQNVYSSKAKTVLHFSDNLKQNHLSTSFALWVDVFAGDSVDWTKQEIFIVYDGSTSSFQTELLSETTAPGTTAQLSGAPTITSDAVAGTLTIEFTPQVNTALIWGINLRCACHFEMDEVLGSSTKDK